MGKYSTVALIKTFWHLNGRLKRKEEGKEEEEEEEEGIGNNFRISYERYIMVPAMTFRGLPYLMVMLTG